MESYRETSVSPGAAEPPLITAADLRLTEGETTPVISRAQKFIIPVASLAGGGEPLVHSEGAQAGTPILDYKGERIGDRGLVFFNPVDQTVQAVTGDGSGAIIINEVTAEQAQQLHSYIIALNSHPNQLTLPQLRQTLAYAHDALELGDTYSTTRDFIQTKMTPVSADHAATIGGPDAAVYGFKKRDDRDINQAIYIAGAFLFQGPAATPQVFEAGGVIVRQGRDVRGVQPAVFLRTYTFSNGQPIPDVADLATQKPF